jgi:hypothetical protein
MTRARVGWLDAARRLALPAAVIVAAGHMVKGVAKIASWIGYLPPALRDPGGNATATAISRGLAEAPPHLLSAPAVAVIGVALVGTATLLAIREAKLAEPDAGDRLRAPLVGLGLAYAVVIAGWSGWMG